MFIPIERYTSIPKMVIIKVFLVKPKHQYYLSQWEDYVKDAQSWKERRLLCESVFVQIDGCTLIPKMVERDVFLMKPKHQYHLSQWGEWICGTQSLKKRRILCESEFIQLKIEL